MTPQARVQAAIDLLDEIVAAARGRGAAADTLIARYFKTRRYAGSKDRRAVRDLVYAAIRRSGEAPSSGRAAMVGLARERPEIAELFDGSPYGPVPLLEAEPASERSIAPNWLSTRFSEAIPARERASLLERAPLDIRVNRLKASRDDLVAVLPDAVPTPHARDGLRFPEGTNVEQTPQWREGLIEVQDEGSQLAALAAGAMPGMTVLDLCAGAGGKTLALAATMHDSGHLIACDVDRARLARLAPRAARAGVTIVETRLLDPGKETAALSDLSGKIDIVFVDAPCSGSGTWRRNPETRWRLTRDTLNRLVALQARLLDMAAESLRPGGSLSYVVCSLLAEEGERQIDAFLDRQVTWSVDLPDLPVGRRAGQGLLLTPAHDGTDGFFIARLRAPC